jgi:hypothetical protein
MYIHLGHAMANDSPKSTNNKKKENRLNITGISSLKALRLDR